MPRWFSFLQTPLAELGEASLAVALVGAPLASRSASQAPGFYPGVLDFSLIRQASKGKNRFCNIPGTQDGDRYSYPSQKVIG